MQKPILEQPNSLPEQFASFGEPEFVFSPTPGQTGCGVVAAVVLAMLSLLPLIEIEKYGLWRTLGTSAFFAVPSLGMVFYVWRKRKWRLMLCRNGVIQMWASGTESLLWAEVRAVSATRSGSSNGRLLELVLRGKTSEICIGGVVNYDDWHNLLETVLKSSQGAWHSNVCPHRPFRMKLVIK